MMGSKSDQFVHDLVQFYRNRGSHNTHPQQFVARLNGKIVNLLELYTYVLELGGSFKVNQLNQWDDIYCKLFKTSVTGANISVALRQIYSRFLLPYERAFSSNFGNDLLDDEEDESNLFFANHSNFTVPSHQYQQSIYSNTVHDSVHPLNKLFCSILSQLPNELDFALKVSTILVNSNRFDWSSDSKFIDLILESTVYYCCICDEENDIIGVNYNKCNGKVHCNEQNEIIRSSTCCLCYQRFWYQCCTNEHVLELVFDSTKTNIKHKEISSQLYCVAKERIKLIADLIRNLSFTYDNQSQDDVNINLCSTVSSTGGTTNMLKFVLLMMMCDEPSFNNIAFDILSNITPATAIVNEDLQYCHLQQFLYRHCIFIAMTSNNIFSTVRSLEIVSKLLSIANEELISTLESYLIEYEIFSRITQLLTCHYEITLLLAMLDFCLSISEQRPHLLVKDSNKFLIKILLLLLNCETSQHFTTCALKRIKVIDERPQVRAQANGSVDSNSSQNTSHSTAQPNSQFNNSQSIIVDNETFALNWLRTTYEPITTNCIQSQSLKVSELYADYVKYCCRSSRRNVIAAQSFSQLIKRCFPSCSITNNSNLIEGIIVKSISNNTIQTKSNQTPSSQLASPILKAHLSAPPKNSNNSSTSNNNNNNNNKTSNNSDLTNCNTVTLTPTTNTSTLIKSLLANKLRSNATISSPTPLTPTKTLSNDTSTVIMGTKESNNSYKSESPQQQLLLQQQPQQQQQQQQLQQQPQASQPPSITFTPTITFTTSNTIINASNASISTQALQQPAQQFLLVRTIITPTGQQQSGCSGLTTTGTPVRLILPASMLTQQRLSNPTVNGITTTSASINNATISTTNSITNNNNTVNTSSDLFLKTVLSGNNTSNSLSVSPMRSNVKSSPLLNVLLDKGKLPDFASSPSIINNQVNANAFGSITNAANVNVIQQQAPKMYIITTKSPLAIKSLPSLQTQSVTQSVQQTTQTLPQQQIVSNCSVVQQNSIHSQQTSNFISNATLSNVQSFTLSTNLNNSPNKTIQSSKICIPSQINGELGPTIATVPSIKANILNASDLSSIKDIKKTVDDATKLIAKRQTEEESINANKKLKLNSVLVNPITQCLASSQITVNHDSNTQQVLAKAYSAATTITTTTTSATTSAITSATTSSNLVNSVSNNILCGEYECQWHECKKSFIRAAEVFLHVHNHHVMPSTFPDSMTCLWGGTEGTGPGCLSKRPKLSLLTHLLDFHCNQNILHQEVARKKQIASKGSTSIVLQQPPAHPGYAHNAALLAIRRHATNYVEMPAVPPVTQLTPLTVSIRLTAALILRNLAQHSSFVKRTLEYYEPYLCELSMADGRDESRTIAQCLAVINERNMLSD